MSETITYRPLESKDLMLLLEWTNEPETRLNSFNTNQITLKEHTAWFNKTIQNPNAVYFICQVNKIAVGLVRFDKNENYTTVGINISSVFRGQGLSSTFLKDCSQLYFLKNSLIINAFIKPQNVASIKAFEKAGYSFLKETEIKNAKAVVYKLEKNEQ